MLTDFEQQLIDEEIDEEDVEQQKIDEEEKEGEEYTEHNEYDKRESSFSYESMKL